MQTHVRYSQESDNIMMKAETLYPLDLELKVLNQGNQMEQVWLTKNQFEVLKIVAKALDQTIKWLTESILSMLECELEDNVAQKLRRKLAVQEVNAS